MEKSNQSLRQLSVYKRKLLKQAGCKQIKLIMKMKIAEDFLVLESCSSSSIHLSSQSSSVSFIERDSDVSFVRERDVPCPLLNGTMLFAVLFVFDSDGLPTMSCLFVRGVAVSVRRVSMQYFLVDFR